jgi:thymidylate synthase
MKHFVSEFDNVYYNLCDKILKYGTWTENRTGISSRKVPAFHFTLHPDKEFPILTTKQVFIRQAIVEMFWIYQEQSNDVRWLQERNVHIWDLWEINENGDWLSDTTGEVLKHFDPSFAHTIGTAYGYIVKKYGLIDRLLDTLKNNPTDRRMLMSLWQDCELETAVLPSCVWSSEWDVTDGKLNLWVHQRSCDVPLGLPFNVTQYAALQALIARECGLEVGTIDWSIKDAHIYENQIEGIEEQQRRFMERSEEWPIVKLWLNPDKKKFYDFEVEDIKLENYKHDGKISFKLAQ